MALFHGHPEGFGKRADMLSAPVIPPLLKLDADDALGMMLQ